jgi:putative salt-induced outer membrane protein
MRVVCLLLAVVLVGLNSMALADEVILKNGDRMTGTVVKSDGKTLVLHTDAAGDVTIKFSEIQDLKTEKELHVSLKKGQSAVGPVTTTDGKIAIATKTAGTIEAPKDDVTFMRNDAEQLAYDQSLHPGLLHGWNGGANVGFSLARGNSDTTNLGLGINATHPTQDDKIAIYLTSIDTTNGLATPSTVARIITAGIRYDRNFGARWFVFVSADFMSNALQDLDLRSVYGGGLGYHAIKSDKTTLDILAGLNYTHEVYSNGPLVTPVTVPPTYTSYGVTNRYAAVTLGEELTQKAGKSTVITENFYFFPDLTDSYTGQYRGTFNLGMVTKISKWLGWQFQFGDIYVSNPPVDTKKNDVILTMGLNVSFGTGTAK